MWRQALHASPAARGLLCGIVCRPASLRASEGRCGLGLTISQQRRLQCDTSSDPSAGVLPASRTGCPHPVHACYCYCSGMQYQETVRCLCAHVVRHCRSPASYGWHQCSTLIMLWVVSCILVAVFLHTASLFFAVCELHTECVCTCCPVVSLPP